MPSLPTPNLFLIGTHKGGTTSFYEMLSTHPAIHAPEPKEPGYFSLTPQLTESNLSAYRQIYSEAREQHRFILDGSTSYAQTNRYPETVGRIAEHCGNDLKFIYLLRDPIERIRAAYVQLRSEGNNDLPREFSQALPRLIEPTLYHTHYQAYASVWGPESIFVATFEELISDPDALSRRCQTFLGIEQCQLQSVHANAGTDRNQNSPVLDSLMQLPGALPLAKRLVDSPVGGALLNLRSRLSSPVVKPDLTPQDLGAKWAQIRDEAEAILDIAGADHSVWPSLQSTKLAASR